MAFTDKERADWHRARRNGDDGDGLGDAAPDLPVCLHCGNPFAPSAGVVTDDAAICDVCNGD